MATVPMTEAERKVVTVLFADLVGFTSRAERLDPEDVRAVLSPYYARLRGELERFGGTVEKFIGDAVMALFGAPATHEDDPERAVRAALAIRDWVCEQGQIEVRLGVATGEALITLGARLSEGEGMAAGDVVNTAARLQAAAPVNGILVGERTFRATRAVVEYRSAEPVVAKGKKEPVAVWEAVAARARLGVDVPRRAKTALVGRERELGLLRDALARVRLERTPQLVTLVGVPGIGKSRLLYELRKIADAEAELISWRQGRSLPYGDGISFWALTEIVKAQAGILDTDTAGRAHAKLAAMVASVMGGAVEADWVQRHLSALAGVGEINSGGPSGGGLADGDRRSEVFAAWRQFVEALAETRPLVLVFEDLHWADDGLLGFIDYLAGWAYGVPLLVMCTARPELLARRPGWGGGKPNALTLSLTPLPAQDIARLIASLTGHAVLEAQQQRLLARAGGNPLFAEQYAQMLTEHGADTHMPVPESVQAIIGARLDLLAPEEKRLLHDAAVTGKVFWPGAVAALSSIPGNGALDEVGLEGYLHGLEAKQFVRRERASSVAGQAQYAFAHMLVRDVAYGQIPRAARAGKHAQAAAWIESLGRAEDHAEMLAHHYLAALDLARAAGQDTTGLAPRARAAAHAAGNRAYALNSPAAAAEYYRAALALWPGDAREDRAVLGFQLALAMGGAGEDDDGVALEQARSALLAVGDRARAAEAEARLAGVWWQKGHRDRCFEHLGRAQELVGDQPASAEKAHVLSDLARYRMLAGEFDVRSGSEALQLAETLGLDEVRAHVLITNGVARTLAGDPDGATDVKHGLEIARAGNFPSAAIRGYTNLAAISASTHGDMRKALRFELEAEKVAARAGTKATLRVMRGATISFWFELGSWDQCAPAADEFLAESATLGPSYRDAGVLSTRAWMRLACGDLRAALDDQARLLMHARQAKDPQVLLPALAISAYLLAAADRAEEGRQLLDELFRPRPTYASMLLYTVTDCMLAADMLSYRDKARRWLRTRPQSPWFAAARALADAKFVQAAESFDAMAAARSAALARLRAAQELINTGEHSEAAHQLGHALKFFRSVGATHFIQEAETLAGSP